VIKLDLTKKEVSLKNSNELKIFLIIALSIAYSFQLQASCKKSKHHQFNGEVRILNIVNDPCFCKNENGELIQPAKSQNTCQIHISSTSSKKIQNGEKILVVGKTAKACSLEKNKVYNIKLEQFCNDVIYKNKKPVLCKNLDSKTCKGKDIFGSGLELIPIKKVDTKTNEH